MEINITKLKTYAETISVLYVEDDVNIQEQIHILLSRFFPNIDLAQNGEEGLFSYTEKKHDLVISDINMPIMNGIEMIKKLNEFEEPPVTLVTSAYNNSDYLIQLINLNVSQFVLKPFNHKQFLIDLYYIAEKIFFKKEYLTMQEKLKHTNQTLHDMIENSNHAIVILEKNQIKSANPAFMELAGYKDMESLNIEMPQLGSLFDPCYNCIQAEDNQTFLKVLQEEDKSKHLVKRYAENMNDSKEYAVGLSEVSKENETYLLSFTEISPYLKNYKFDPTTGLPNRISILENIETLRMDHSTIFTLAITIKHFEEYAKWKGKQGAKDLERLISEQITGRLQQSGFYKDVILTRFGRNQFLLLSAQELQEIVPYIKGLKIHPANLNQEKTDQKIFNFTPMHKLLSFPGSLDLESLEIQLINTYDELLF